MRKSKKFLSLLLGGLMISSTIVPVTVSAGEQKTEEGSDISIYHFYQYPDDPDTGGSWASGPWAQAGESYIPLWEYNPEKTNISDGLLSTNYFRTAEGEVAYCMNYGKLVPSDTVYPNEETSFEVQRVVSKGYPSMKGSDYNISDIELEWATGVALNIIEGNGYNSDGEIVPDSELKLEYFYNDVFDYTYSKKNYPNIPDDVLTDYTEQADKIRDVVAALVASAYDESIELNYLNIDTTNASMTANSTTLDPGVTFGPFMVNTNRSDVSVTFEGSIPENMSFTNSGGEEITSIPLNEDFYLKGDANCDLSFTLKVSDKTGIHYPSHLYRNGNVSDQSMYIVKSLPLEDAVKMIVNYLPIVTADLNVKKFNEDKSEVLPDTVFGLYDEYMSLLKSETTDSDGIATFKELVPGTYYVHEETAPEGYILDDTFFEVVVDGNGFIEKLEDNTLIVTDKTTKVVLSKTDVTTSEPVPGAEITVKNASDEVVYKGITEDDGTITINALPVGEYTFTETIAPDGYIASSETYSFTIKEDGSVSGTTDFTNRPTEVAITKTDFTTSKPVPGAEITVKNSNNKIVFSDVTDENGQIKLTYLPVGKYTFEETQAPEGYEKLTQTFSFEILSDGSIKGDTNITNKPTKVSLLKVDSTTSKGLPGAEIKVKNTETGKEYVGVTDENGYYTLTYLPAGKYSWSEIKAPAGYVLSKDACYFEISKDGKISGTITMGNKPTEVVITKSDITDAQPIPGAEISIIDVETNETIFRDVTDKEGKIRAIGLTPGKYVFKETVAPSGYILSSETLSFVINEDGSIVGDNVIYNTPTKVVIHKKDAETGTPLSGAKFQIKNSKNNVIYTGVTDEFGMLTITKLPVGKYTYTEIEAPSGYIASTERYSFEIKDDGTIIGEFDVYNKAPSVSILKLDANTNKPLAGAVIIVKNRAGEVVYTGETNEEGVVTITGLPVGTYTYTESKAPAGYIISTRTYTFIIDANGKVSGDTEITNTSTRVVITKRDITNGKVLEGATIEVKNSDNTTVFKGNTDKNGQIIIERLPVGTYTFSETVAPKGYDLNTETLKFTIADDGTVTGDVEMFDVPSTPGAEKPTTPQEEENTPPSGEDNPEQPQTIEEGSIQTGQKTSNALLALTILSSLVVLSMAYYKRRNRGY